MGGDAGGTQAEGPAADPVPAGCQVGAVSVTETRSVDRAGSFLFRTLVFFCSSFQVSKSRMPLPRKKCSPQKAEAKKKRGGLFTRMGPKVSLWTSCQASIQRRTEGTQALVTARQTPPPRATSCVPWGEHPHCVTQAPVPLSRLGSD